MEEARLVSASDSWPLLFGLILALNVKTRIFGKVLHPQASEDTLHYVFLDRIQGWIRRLMNLDAVACLLGKVHPKKA